MTVLITGANGFVGSHLIDNLRCNYKVVGQVRNIVNSVRNDSSLFTLDVNGTSDWNDSLKSVNVVIHLAGIAHNKSSDFHYMREVNVNGTINLAQQSVKNGVKRFIFISSIVVLGNRNTNNLPFNEHSPHSAYSEYAHTKLDAENALLKIAEETGLEVIIIRPVLVYGIGAPGNFGKLVKLVNKVSMLPFALCTNKRSFISVDNLVDFISTCIDHPKAKNEIFCISDGNDVSIREVTDGIALGLNKKLIQLPIPVFIFKLLGKITGRSEPIEQLIGVFQVDSSKARQLLNWTPPFTMAETFIKLSNNK
ncbi:MULTISPECIES: NAD-dependent epimerase/dehydratase family protein [unclassified Colwellia]|uniref:NAD-dependent epimerase/dehydratase family protein n=1 Tax=unclassified Colwellia TaxID=196834 RepID=UPI0015F38797|nr:MULTISPECIES: NAD-dependent epimerase/dehydratase family protein [unclassified Colwellia]MBA6381045.1 NAD-dependent epimerase/dehydratase family protein [Colwellia sp. BRX10-7]MBA6388703.1 NAD-dependent epimerase/dehydratase family protein [Colwellia sp. BRX10-2]MBA6400017.1 NAD-dependent epimerase/dehydratase family protein [Colwellia sp. BRX10-5]MBA6403896.1 NAD-dependent epimerase/dehydratase family protein [Colwellia sp. BRX10-1]